MAAATEAPVCIRAARLDDADAIAELSTQLGYPTAAPVMHERLARVRDARAGEVFVAVDAQQRVLGWTHASPCLVLERDPCVELAGLIVDASARGGGIGALLLEAAESWSRAHGFGALRVHSNVVRERAHRFYLQRGYVSSKEQAVFEKAL
jgi:GNAT superfamily N-acetyltransferase